jgi:hypothetical protein
MDFSLSTTSSSYSGSAAIVAVSAAATCASRDAQTVTNAAQDFLARSASAAVSAEKTQ